MLPTLPTLLFWAGIGHLVLALGSVAVPKLLDWKAALSSTPVIIRQMFWTYAGYILMINVWFGLVSILGPDSLLDGSFLAKCITLLIALYWLARVVIQFVYFDKTDIPKGFIYTWGEVALVALFVVFTVVYSIAFFHNMTWI